MCSTLIGFYLKVNIPQSTFIQGIQRTLCVLVGKLTLRVKWQAAASCDCIISYDIHFNPVD